MTSARTIEKSFLQRYRTAGILLGMLFVLGGIATWDEWESKKEEDQKKSANRLVSFDPESATTFDYDSKGVDVPPTTDAKAPEISAHQPLHVSLEKRSGQWWLTSPISGLADQEILKGLFTAIKEFKYDKVVSEKGENLKDFGLDTPTRTLKLGNETESVSIFVGNKSPVDYNVYVRTDKGPQVLIGSQYLLVASGKSLFEFRDKTIVRFDEKAVKSLSINGDSGNAMSLEVKGEQYVITKPETMEADSGLVKSYVAELSRLKASEFIDQPDKDLLKLFSGKKLATIRWQSGEGNYELLLVDAKGKLFARLGEKGQIVGLAEDTRKKLLKNASDFRNRRIFNFVGDKVNTMEIDGVRFVKEKGDFYTEEDAAKVTSTKAGEVVSPKYYVRSLLVDLEFGQAEDFYGLHDKLAKELESAPQHRIILGFEDKAMTPVTIDLWPVKNSGKDNPEKFYLKASTGKYLYKVSKTLIANIKKPSEIHPSAAETPSDDSGEAAPLDMSGLGAAPVTND